MSGYCPSQSPEPDRAAEEREAEEQGCDIMGSSSHMRLTAVAPETGLAWCENPAPDQQALAAQILADHDRWTAGERWAVAWQLRLLGSFDEALVQTITLADPINLERLRAGYPGEVAGIEAWRHGDLAARLRAVGLDV